MFRQIRTLMSEEVQLEGSLVEMDETYMGGRRKGYKGRPGRGDKKMTPVVGIAERTTGNRRVIARATQDVTANTLMGMVKEYVLPESTIFTDDFSGYDRLNKHGFTHRRINHSAKIWVMGDIHTNTIEGFWSLVKRGIGGVYHQISQKYLQSYLDEYTFRYNRRDRGNLIFSSLLEKVSERAS
jgi:transposase-like protein